MGGSVREGQIWNSLKCTAGMWARGIYQSESSVVQGTSSLQLRLPTSSVSDVFVGSFRRSRINHLQTVYEKGTEEKKEKIYMCVCVVRLYFNPCYTLQMFPLWTDNGATVFVCQTLPDLHIHQGSWQYCNVLRCWQLALVWLWPYGWRRGAAVTQNFPGKIPITEHSSVMPMSM